MRKILIGTAILAFTALMLAFGLNLQKQNNTVDPMVGKKAPAITAEIIPRISDRGHKTPIYLVNFWATWCAPCIYEHPVLMELADRGVEIRGVAYKDDKEKIQKFLDKRGDPFSTLYYDPEGDVMLDYGNTGVPETFVIGPDGIIRARVRGPVTPQVFREEILPAIRQ